MNLDIDPAKVLYAVGVLFGIAAVLYFARDIVFELSITVRALLLLLAFIGLLVGALATTRQPLVSVFAVLSAAAYLAFLGYTLSRFSVGADGTFMALLVSAALFLALAYLVRDRGFSPSPRVVRYTLVAILLVAVALVGADMLVSDVEYAVTVADSGAVAETGQVSLGTVTVTNQFVYREQIDVPQALACVYVPGMEYDRRPTPVQLRLGDERVPESVPGGGTYEVDMTVRLTPDELSAVDGPITIQRTSECPPTRDEPTIVVVIGNGMPRPPPP